MKRYKYCLSLFLFLSAGLFSSCSLDEYNPSGATEVVWESSPEGFMTLVNATYNRQRYWYGKVDGIFMAESGTDLWFNRDKRLWAAQFSQYNNLEGNTGQIRNTWRELYNGVLHCNAGVNRIDNIEWTSEEEKNVRLAEMRFMRAFYYWHIVETWGGVILRVDETQNPEQYRSPVEAFYDLMIADLQFAAEHLPLSHGDEYSRATKKAAFGLLARVALTRASYGDGETYYQMALDAARTVIDSQAEFGVELWDNYADLWDPNNNRNNKEALFVIANSTNISLNFDNNANQLHQFFLTQYAGRPGLNLSMEYGRDEGRQLMPTLGLLDFYNEDIDARYHATFQETWIANTNYTWTAEDAARLRKDPAIVGTTMRAGIDTAMLITKKSVPNKSLLPYNVIDRDSVYETSTNGNIRIGNDFVVLKKYMDPITRDGAGAQGGFLDIIILRLAEMYLVAAEAELMLGNTVEAASYINVLRTRAAIKSPVDRTAEMQVNASQIDLDFILEERARELCGEHIRWFDLKRTRKLGEYITKYNPDITQFQEHHYLRPVSQDELNALLNSGEFGQNPGY